MIQEDEVTVTVTVIAVETDPPTALLVHDTVGVRGARRRITQKVAITDPDLLARATSCARAGNAVKAVIGTEWREDSSLSYLRDLIPKADPRNGMNGTATSGVPTLYDPTPTTKLPAMVKEK